MQINYLIQPSVGADLSRPSPIYRPSRDVPYADNFVNSHYPKGYHKYIPEAPIVAD